MSSNILFENKRKTKLMKVSFCDPPKGYRLRQNSDIELKKSEKEKVIKEIKHSTCIYDWCTCCDNDEIEKIIGRKVFPCFACNCCEDNGYTLPANEHIRIYVNDSNGNVHIDTGKIEKIKNINK